VRAWAVAKRQVTVRLEGKVRYYPYGTFDRFSVGVGLGLMQADGEYNEDGSFGDEGPTTEFTSTAPSLAFEVGYTRLYGAQRHLGYAF
jgi:hypothetical protein